MTLRDAIRLLVAARYGADKMGLGIVPQNLDPQWSYIFGRIRYLVDQGGALNDPLSPVLNSLVVGWLRSVGMKDPALGPDPAPPEPVPATPRPQPFARKFS